MARDLRRLEVVVMPDFFFDRILDLKCATKDLCRKMVKMTEAKGGNIDSVAQKDMRGGNAANTASALLALGAAVTPIVCTNKLGMTFLRSNLSSDNADLSHVKVLEKASMTTSLELETRNGKVNIMLRDVGSLAEFGPLNLDDRDFESIRKADYVCVFNWAGTKRMGTELARTVFRRTKSEGNGKTYLDTADPDPNREKIPELMRKVLQSESVDVLSLNENEAIRYARQISKKATQRKKDLPLEEKAKDSAMVLASCLPARIDLHTTSFSATFSKKSATIVPSFRVPVLRATGAGDAWNAANIVGDAHGLSDSSRLTLANAVAAYYISCSRGEHPTRPQLDRFLAGLE